MAANTQQNVPEFFAIGYLYDVLGSPSVPWILKLFEEHGIRPVYKTNGVPFYENMHARCCLKDCWITKRKCEHDRRFAY